VNGILPGCRRPHLRSISVAIATDVRSLTKAWHSKIKIGCPHCQETHHFKVSEAFTNAAISDERLRGVFSRLD
jgi:hypothetical protein